MTWQETVSTVSPAASASSPPMTQPEKKSRRTLLIVAIVVVLVSCLGALLLLWSVGQQVLGQAGPTLTALAEETLVGGASKTPTSSPVKASATPIMIPTKPVAKATPPPSVYYIWTKGSASATLFQEPHENGAVTGYIPNGTPVEVQERRKADDQIWLHVSDGKKEGWLPDSVAFPKADSVVKYVTQGANVREDPKGKILLTLMPGSPVYPTGQTAADDDGQEWAQVKLPDGQVGWMAVWLLEESQ